jgi:Tfp pilus assembly protein PilN
MLKPYYRINEATGIDIHIVHDGNAEINACSVSVNKNQLSIEKKVTGLAGVADLKKDFPAKYVSVNLSGKGVLHKQTALIDEVNENNFGKIFLNANIHDFYVQHFKSGKISFVSVVRRTDADKWLQALETTGYIPLLLSLGPFVVEHIQNQLNVYDGDLIFNGHTIERNESMEWVTYRHAENSGSPFPLKVSLEPIHEKLLVAYAAAFQLVLADQLQLTAADVPDLRQLLDTLLAKRKLKVNGAVVLIIFFILLLINFVLFSSLYSDNNQLADKVSQLTQSSISIQGVQDQVQQKIDLLKELGWDGGINKSALIDQLAALMPDDITLDVVTVNPVDLEQSRLQKAVAFHDRQITLSGRSDKIIPLNEWIARIKTKAWVKDIQLDNYSFNNEQNTGIFTIVINY